MNKKHTSKHLEKHAKKDKYQQNLANFSLKFL